MHRKKARKEVFLYELNIFIPWTELTQIIAAFYPSSKGAGRRPIEIEHMLRIYLLQHWFSLSGPVAELCQYSSKNHKPEPKIHA